MGLYPFHRIVLALGQYALYFCRPKCQVNRVVLHRAGGLHLSALRGSCREVCI